MLLARGIRPETGEDRLHCPIDGLELGRIHRVQKVIGDAAQVCWRRLAKPVEAARREDGLGPSG